jgi:hypothetical protein
MATRAEIQPATYFANPIPAPEGIVMIDPDSNWNDQLANCVELVPEDGEAYWVMECYSKGHASASCSRLRYGMYGSNIHAGYNEVRQGVFHVAIMKESK